ncbi:hypothetical protein L228DRAFT_268578 [Xylona heveae TC161]|uniref:BHLH domain-containing protein n=1 Tax=Xylona heveae (strain CBS 132557 / TC161) TaxID=1328760 RepID=A0A165GE70_XYLHT|nr:hypothetical protein L228DRAFT_268578 [Xylona heveae TC161]KZF22084.1 hypothetical protein L228DRAFT_268578 [Xylona heveae TC161]
MASSSQTHLAPSSTPSSSSLAAPGGGSGPISQHSMSANAGMTPANDKPRLTEQEKKNNHIASEQKRRQAIREGFDRLTELVPGLEGQGRSESVVLKRTIDFMREQLEERRRLVARVEASGGVVSEDMKV